MKRLFRHVKALALCCGMQSVSECATCTQLDRAVKRSVISMEDVDYCTWEQFDVSVAVNCSVPSFPRNMQLSNCLRVQTNVVVLVGSHNLRNIFNLDGGEPSDSTADPDSNVEYRYIPNKALYSEPLALEKETEIGNDCQAANCWEAPLSHGRYYLSGSYGYFGAPPFPSFYPPVGPFAKYPSGDYYVALRLAIGDKTYFGWSRVDGLHAGIAVPRPWVYNPEPGASIRAGMEAVPVTKVRYLDRSVEISWHPVWAEKWKLEASPSLATNATWSAVTSVVSNRVEMATLGSQRFFRLRKSEP